MIARLLVIITTIRAPFLRFYLHLRTVCALLYKKALALQVLFCAISRLDNHKAPKLYAIRSRQGILKDTELGCLEGEDDKEQGDNSKQSEGKRG